MSDSLENNTELTELQVRFVAEYVADPRSATRAYQLASNFSTTPAHSAVIACQLLKKLNIQAAVKSCRRDWLKRHRFTFNTVVRKLAAIAFADSGDLYESDPENSGMPRPRPWNCIAPTARKNIKSIKFKRRKLKSESAETYELEEFEYKVADQEWALGQLCLYLGVTKGSLTADELRAALYEHLHQPAVPPSLPGANGPANLEGSTNPDEGCDPPAVRT